jgi:hypothetical protein
LRIKIFGYTKEERVLRAINRRWKMWFEVFERKGYRRIQSHPNPYFHDELDAVRRDVEKILYGR